MPFAERREIIKAIVGVDQAVASIDEDNTCADTLHYIQPDIFAKGGDRLPENMPNSELKACEKYDISIVYGVGGGKIQASSELIKQVRISSYGTQEYD